MPSSSWATRPFVIVLSSYNFNFVGRVGIEPTLEQINSLCEKDWIACWQITPIFDGLRKPTFQPPHMYLWAWRDSNSQNTCTSSMPVYLNCGTNPYCCAEGGIRTHTLSLLRRSRLPVATLQHLENRWDSNSRELIRLEPNICASSILFSLYRRVDLNHRPRGYESLATTTVLRRYVGINYVMRRFGGSRTHKI